MQPVAVSTAATCCAPVIASYHRIGSNSLHCGVETRLCHWLREPCKSGWTDQTHAGPRNSVQSSRLPDAAKMPIRLSSWRAFENESRDIFILEWCLKQLPYTTYYYYNRSTACSRTSLVSRYQKGKTSLDLNEARNDVGLGCSGFSWTI